MDPKFTFKAPIWLWDGGKASWHFITVPQNLSKRIKGFEIERKGFGSMPVKVTIGKSTWKTSIFPSKEIGSYILPRSRHTDGLCLNTNHQPTQKRNLGAHLTHTNMVHYAHD
ncbi:MAG: DUF1905 domain-containing protein [Candidatus Peregrinibacteria bacterium]|nr:DUF1905 domain-containing protein [Candidatus Peregrinibacteria bacterium]